ncbi:phytanoyl-CoA dioxygenase family protein [Pelagibius sp.]|uniref:phytanoyl-CoA dioxygenase family protein n=1 Tax=Pelagibius sp. TaxID=1931238 RepID=UPI0026367D2E|nr:phytanoyl-CoA dioxygenase family protein [Pelagibius sp.]
MEQIAQEAATQEGIVTELIDGRGYVVLPQVFTAAEIAEARALIMRYSDSDAPKATHFQGANPEKLHLQRRVWNLLNKGDIFVAMVQREPVVSIMRRFLGSEFILGSIAANRLLPGGPGQELHIDYPYWDMYKPESFPARINPSFPLNAQVTILLDDFTAENGATAIVPGSQKLGRYPSAEDRAAAKLERMTGKAGDVAIFFGLAWHSAMPNDSDGDRSAVLIQYLPKFVKPMEDQVRGLDPQILDRASPLLRQLVGLDYPYPQLLDEAEAGNAEGRVA